MDTTLARVFSQHWLLPAGTVRTVVAADQSGQPWDERTGAPNAARNSRAAQLPAEVALAGFGIGTFTGSFDVGSGFVLVWRVDVAAPSCDLDDPDALQLGERWRGTRRFHGELQPLRAAGLRRDALVVSILGGRRGLDPAARARGKSSPASC